MGWEMAPPQTGWGWGWSLPWTPLSWCRRQRWTHCRVLDLHFSRAVSCLPFPTQLGGGALPELRVPLQGGPQHYD